MGKLSRRMATENQRWNWIGSPRRSSRLQRGRVRRDINHVADLQGRDDQVHRLPGCTSAHQF
jgi:hypothetical protein